MAAERRSTLLVPLALCGVLVGAGAAHAAQITIVNNDGPGEGFNDPTPVAPALNNPGTTLGEQRLNVANAVADALGDLLQSSVEIMVDFEMNALFCAPNSALLGQAGPADYFRDFANAPLSNTWHPSPLADALAGQDLDPGAPDIFAEFNRNLDDQANCLGGQGWNYDIDGPLVAARAGGPQGGGSGTSFLETVYHEILHGLGFTTLVDPETGERALGRNDHFMVHLEDHSTGKSWSQMSNSERQASAIDTGDLHWTGASVVAKSNVLSAGTHPSGHVQMYSPNPLELGSSVAHWAGETTPDEIMEAFATPNPLNLITSELLEDIGWVVLEGPIGPCVPDATTLCLNDGRFKVTVTWRNPQGATGDGTAIAFTDNSGLFWFFSENNIEMLIKVLRACGFNQRYWVFFAATTTVEFTVTVTDTETGAIKIYTNTQGQAANAVTDTNAFATCPAPPPPTSGLYTSLHSGAGTEREEEIAALVAEERAAAESLLAGLNGGPRLAVSASDAIAEDADRSPVSVRPMQKVRVTGNGNIGPEGTTYEPAFYIGVDEDNDGLVDLFTLQDSSTGDNVVTFDGVRENLRRFLANLGLSGRARVNETISQISSLRTSSAGEVVVRIVITWDGAILFPDGFVNNLIDNLPLIDGAVTIAGFGGLPLLFENSGLVGAEIVLRRGGSVFARFDLGGDLNGFFGSGASTSWGGTFAAVFGDITSENIDRVDLELEVRVPGGGPIGPGPVEPFDCVEDDVTACLNNNRFEVVIEYADFDGGGGPGFLFPIPGVDDSTTFYFLGEDNIELLIKVLTGCGLNDHYWVFYAATTNLEFTVTVTDSHTGMVKQYFNPLGQPAETITDTQAFATCP